jgi:antitoxin component YwqK of YwqJK toxin-antitoxin module
MFKADLFEGQGTMSKGNAIWSGGWYAGKMSGHGKWKNGKDSYEGEYYAGLWDGQGTRIYSDGSKYEGGYKHNEWYGEGIYTTEKGFKSQATYVRGKPMNCKYRSIYPNGKTEWEYVYKDSLIDGVAKQYSEDGKIQQEMNYVKGILNGSYKQYYEDGKIQQDANYKNGLWDGGLKGYYKNGILRVDCVYRDGKLWNITVYNMPDGKPAACSLKDGNGQVKRYYDDGKIKEDVNFKNGVQDGEYKSYYENGTLWSDYFYRDGKVWNTIADNMPDGKPTGTNVKDGNGISMGQSPDGAVIISKTTYENGVAVKTETLSD